MVGNALGSVGLSLFVLGVSWIVLPLVAFVVEFLRALVPPPRAESERLPPEPEPVREVMPIPAPPPPPPTREERLAAAREHYEKKLRMLETAGLDETERGAARAKAKQQYLRAIDDVMR